MCLIGLESGNRGNNTNDKRTFSWVPASKPDEDGHPTKVMNGLSAKDHEAADEGESKDALPLEDKAANKEAESTEDGGPEKKEVEEKEADSVILIQDTGFLIYIEAPGIERFELPVSICAFHLGIWKC